MQRLIILLLILMSGICGCASGGVIIPFEPEDIIMTYRWPVLIGTPPGGPPVSDSVDIIFWNTATSAFVRTNVITDALPFQWTPQRNGIGWRSSGKWGVGIIETTSFDLEYWENTETGWTAAGAWGLTDDDASQNWEAVDVATRQNWVWAEVFEAGGPSIRDWYIDLSAGVPAWTYAGHTRVVDDAHYSVVLDQNLLGARHIAYIAVGNITYGSFSDTASTGVTVQAVGDYPQIIVDGEQRLWLFITYDNDLYVMTSFDQPFDTSWNGGVIYSATTLTQDYMVAHNPVDDTIHVVLCDVNMEGTSTLKYLRRTRNGWSAAITLKTLTSVDPTYHVPTWPQITIDSFCNICIYYIDDDMVGVGDLCQFLLPYNLYSGFATPANWTETTNVDDSADDILWCVAPPNMPEDV